MTAVTTPLAAPKSPITLNVQSGQALTFTTFFAQTSEETDSTTHQPTVTWSPELLCPNGGPTLTVSPVNAAVLAGPQSNPTQGFAGGFRNWFYGEWSTQYTPFMENEIGQVPSGVSSTSPGAPFFTRVNPRWEGIHRGASGSTLPSPASLQLTGPLWSGSGGDFYITAGQWKPSRIGGVDPGDLGSSAGLAKTLSQTTSVSASAGVSVIDAPNGSTDEQRELLDLNGDRRPDVIDSNGNAQFQTCATKPCDGSQTNLSYSASASLPNFSGSPRHTDNQNMQFGIGFGSTASAIAQKAKASGATQAVLSVLPSLGQGYGTSTTSQDTIDVNGDGLPDRVSTDSNGNLSVQLNFGYGFQPAVTWPLGHWGDGFNTDPDIPTQSANPSSTFNPVSGVGSDVSTAISGFFGQSLPSPDTIRWQDNVTDSLQVGYAGIGGGFAYSVSRTLVDFVDVNGDGLPDRVMRQPGTDQVFVRLNLGNGFAPSQQWKLPQFSGTGGDFTNAINGTNDSLAFSETTTYDVGVGVPILIPIPPPVAICLSIEISEQISQGNGVAELTWQDINGDGALDHVLLMKGSSSVVAELNQTSQTNLLTSVSRPLGGSFKMTYQRDGNVAPQSVAGSSNFPGYQIDMPSNQWALASVTVSDSPGNSTGEPNIAETFSYNDPASGIPSGFYDRTERENYGYHFVTTTRSSDGSTHVDVYDTSDYYHRGLLDASYERDSTGHLFTRLDVSYQATSGTPSSVTGSFFPKENSRTTSFYEGTTTDPTQPGVTTSESRQWDNLGNLTRMTDSGDTGLADTVVYNVTYDATLAASRIFRPGEVTATDGSGHVLRDRKATYDGRAALLTMTNIVSGGTDPSGNPYSGAAQTWNFATDSFGNITKGVDPRGYTLNYVFDSTVETYRASTSDSFGYSSSCVYDLRFGLPMLETDTNTNQSAYSYDQFGRLQTVDAPTDIGTSEHTIVASYSFPVNGGTAPFPAFATTAHKDIKNPGTPIATSSFIDGLERVIETKKSVEKDNGTGTTVGMSVSGAVAFDARGRLTTQGQPTFSTSQDPTLFVAPAMLHATAFTYDILNRTVSTQTPDGAQMTTAYGFDTLGSTKRLATTVKDANVNANANLGLSLPGTARESFRSVREDILAVKDINRLDGVTPTSILTQYAFDALDQLLSVTDAKGNVTSAAYDTIGRMVSVTSPDMGLTTLNYDLSNNLGAKQTAALKANNQKIQYQYQFNRLRSVVYPVIPSVSYTYGTPAEAGPGGFNRAGRIESETSQAGTKTYEYDALGNVSQQSWALNKIDEPVGDDTMKETMVYSYDSFGRLLQMNFPGEDAEVVSYGYDRGGNVTTAVGVTKYGGVSNYLLHLGYDEFEERVRMVSGNGVQTSYTYDPLTRRLTNINADERDEELVEHNKPARPFQRMTYAYDAVGNITQIQNNAPVDPTLLGNVKVGPLTENFTYDDLYQLKTATGLHQSQQDDGFHYSLSFNYDAISNVTKKTQSSDTQELSSTGSILFDQINDDQTYTSSYSYGGARPHAPSEVDDAVPNQQQPIKRTLSYDASGNQTGWVKKQQSATLDTRVVKFDEEDRVKFVSDNGLKEQQNLYDGSGQRAVKQANGADQTAYFGPNFTLRDAQLPTKHVFAGTTRVASKLQIDEDGNGPVDYFHDDHLGSTNFTTDNQQNLLAHEEYFPTGELWVDETNDVNHKNQPYLFSGKELDAETSLYYFGARYYDPRLSMWVTPDPLLGSYLTAERQSHLPGGDNYIAPS